jgi:tRNA1(Val) A37 N6-methylase TrmN6
VLDAGCGTGAVALALAARCPGVRVVGIELNPASAALARESVALNGFSDRIDVIDGDLAQPPAALGASFDVVITNPPFIAEGTPPPDAGRAGAHMEGALDLVGWVRACLALLKPKGRLVMIHRGDRVSDLLSALRPSCGDLRIIPIHSRAGDPARRVIVDGGKGRRSPDALLPAFVLHQPDGSFTPQADAVLRDAGPLLAPIPRAGAAASQVSAV